MSPSSVAHWDLFHHHADIGIRGFGESPAAAFEQTARAMTAVITDPARVADEFAVEIHCQAPDSELLLVDWLNALIYQMATRKMLFARFTVSLEDGRLHGTAWGETIDPARHRPAVEIKGATYTELQVAQNSRGGWFAQCVVDV